MSIFSRKSVKEVANPQSDLKQTLRELDRELEDMKRDEIKLLNDTRQAAKQGNEVAIKILAQQVVRLREHQKRIMVTRAGLTGINASLSAAASSAAFTTSIQKAGIVATAVNASMNPSKMQQNMKEFAKNAEKHSCAQTHMDDALDMALFDTDEIDEEANHVMQQLLEEAGAELAGQMAAVGTASTAQVAANATMPPPGLMSDDDEEEESVEQRLAALRAC